MNTNALRIEDVQIVSFPPVMKPALVAVDSEVADLTFFLLCEEEKHATATATPSIFVNSPKLIKLTFTAFLQKGVQGRVRGLNSLLGEQDYQTRREGLRLLAALYSVFKRREATTLEKVTAETMSAAFARLDRDRPAASQDWIDAYKARTEAAFEGKAARQAKKEGFCQAVFGGNNS